jgi:hypothetical protein
MKLWRAVFAGTLCVAFSVAQTEGQLRPQAYGLNAALEYLNSLSKAYFQTVAAPPNGRFFEPPPEGYLELKSYLGMMIDWFATANKADDERPLKVEDLSPENEALFQSALACFHCAKPAPGAVRNEPPATVGQLKHLLAARAKMIATLIPDSGTLRKNDVIQVETQMQYMRTLVLSYLGQQPSNS